MISIVSVLLVNRIEFNKQSLTFLAYLLQRFPLNHFSLKRVKGMVPSYLQLKVGISVIFDWY